MASIIESVADKPKNPTSKFITTDPAIFKQRMQAYNDSLYAFKNLSTKLSPEKAYTDIKQLSEKRNALPIYNKPQEITPKEKEALKQKGVSYKGIAPTTKMNVNEESYIQNALKGVEAPYYEAKDKENKTILDEVGKAYIGENIWYKEPTQLPVLQESDSPRYADPFYMASKAIQNVPLSKASELTSVPEIVAQKTEKVAEAQVNNASSLANMPKKETVTPQPKKEFTPGYTPQQKPDYGRQRYSVHTGEKSTRAKLIDMVYDESGSIKDINLYRRYKNEFAKMNSDQNYLMNTSLLP
jgi:hypothetical protein